MDLLVVNLSATFCLICSNVILAAHPHRAPTGCGDPTGAGTGQTVPPIEVSGTGRGSEIRDRGGDGECPPGPAPPRCHPESAVLIHNLRITIRLW